MENSEALRGKQRLLLDKYRRHHELEWHDGMEELTPTSMFGGMHQPLRLTLPEEQFTILVAHEFFDALPIRVYEVCRLGSFRSHQWLTPDMLESTPGFQGSPRRRESGDHRDGPFIPLCHIQ